MKSRWEKKKKIWLDRHSRQKKKKSKGISGGGFSYQHASSRTFIPLTPPENFSLVNNSEETNQFFEEFTGEIRSRQYGKEFYIDSSKVEQVTVDALIYLIAILQNNQLNISMNYKFRGNYPENEEARKVYFESGFNDFVASNMKRLPKSSDRFKIVCGETTAPETTGECCQFVMETLGKSRVEIMHLQSVFVELMSNVVCHAYEKNKFMAKKWYIYGEHIDDYVRFIFVDTGLGIAKTVRKNNFEKMRDFFGIGVTDSDLIRSVFVNTPGSEYRLSANGYQQSAR